MAEVAQKISGKICPIREHKRNASDSSCERLCEKACAMFREFTMNGKTYQACRMWPGEANG